MSDINNMHLLNEQIEYNPEAESSSSSVKLPDGTYLMSLALGKFGIDVKTTADKKPYIQAHVQGVVIDPGGQFNSYRANGSISSLVFEDGTSAVTDLLKRAGTPAPATVTLGDLKALVETALQANLQLQTRVRWEAKAKDSSGKWQRVKGMKKFPQNPDGSYSPYVEIDGETVEAYEQIVGFPSAKAGKNAAS